MNRLQDLNYLVRAVNDLASFQESARGRRTVAGDSRFGGRRRRLPRHCRVESDAATQHIPIIAFAGERAAKLQAAAQKAGAKLVVGEAAIADYLPQLLNQALQYSNDS